LIRLVHFRGEPGAASERGAAANDAIGAEHALIHVRDVHGATFSFTGPRGFAEQLGHHPAWINPFRHTVAVPAMRRGHVVGVREMGADSNRDRFLASIEVNKTGNLAVAEFDFDAILEDANGCIRSYITRVYPY
jgi:hypothetical protein